MGLTVYLNVISDGERCPCTTLPQQSVWESEHYTWARFFCLFSGREHAWGELRSAELSTSLQISFFLFLCELSSPWASSRNDRWSWANWEGVSRTLSKAELCNNGPYLDARTDRISPHTSLLPSHTLPHPPKDPLSRISTSKSSQSLDQSSMICRQVVESNYCLLCDVIYPTSLEQASFKKIMQISRAEHTGGVGTQRSLWLRSHAHGEPISGEIGLL